MTNSTHSVLKSDAPVGAYQLRLRPCCSVSASTDTLGTEKAARTGVDDVAIELTADDATSSEVSRLAMVNVGPGHENSSVDGEMDSQTPLLYPFCKKK
jgi:hypothetical protein